MNVLRFDAAIQRSSACLVGGGRIVATVEEERFNRVNCVRPP